MKTVRTSKLIAAAFVCLAAFTANSLRAADPLPSWNDGDGKAGHRRLSSRR